MKFILIDNSIVDLAGHYYQYASFCLKSADSLGYETFLATNKRHADFGNNVWKIIPTYHYGFWLKETIGIGQKIHNSFSNFSKKFKRYQTTKQIQRRYSKLNFYREIRFSLFEILSSQTVRSRDIKISKPLLIFTMLFIGAPIIGAQKLWNNYYFWYVRDKIREYFIKFVLLLKTQPIDPITGLKLLDSRRTSFSKDTTNLFHTISLDKDDHIFMPNIGITELFGLLDFFKKNPNISGSWHLLFRRNIFHGSSLSYYFQKENTRPIRNAFLKFFNECSNNNVFFYTDTEDLTEQYNSLDIFKFQTLPIPHTHSVSKNNPKHPITISYLGDARTEKGYHFLPKIVKDLYRFTQDGIVEFKFQSNFNIVGGESMPAVARRELIDLDSSPMKLFFDPLSIDEYEDLLLTSNIVLLLYDSDNYYARSSGILSEALTAGIPVVVPARTWMSRQFQVKIYEYQKSLLEKLVTVFTINANDLKWKIHGSSKFKKFNDRLFFNDHDNRITSKISISQPANYVLGIFDFDENPAYNSIVNFTLIQLNSNNAILRTQDFILEQISKSNYGTFFEDIDKNTTSILLHIKNPDTPTTENITNLKIHFLNNTDPSIIIPNSVIGRIYHHPNDISKNLHEMIINYQHYLDSARDFSKSYYKLHNPDSLLRILTNREIK